MNKEDFVYMVNSTSAEMIPMIMKDFKCNRLAALDRLYHTKLYAMLQNPDTGLYYQSTRYVYERLSQELKEQAGTA